MGQKTSPIANRLGYIRGWEANWFAHKKETARCLYEDTQIRTYLAKKVPRIIAKTFIERVSDHIIVTIHTSKPGLLIGPGGKKVQLIREDLRKQIKKNIRVNILEKKIPALDARLVAKNIANQIEARGSYKRAANRALDDALHVGAGGIKICIAGRIGGIEIAREVKFKKGRIPSQTFRADVDFAREAAHTTYGTIGVKVWIFKREVYGKRDLSLDVEAIGKTKHRPIHHK